MSIAPTDTTTHAIDVAAPNSSNISDDFNLSKQSKRLIELVNTNKLNKQAGYSIESLTDNIKRFELKLQGQRVSPNNKTAGLVGVVEQTAYDHAFSDIDRKSVV